MRLLLGLTTVAFGLGLSLVACGGSDSGGVLTALPGTDGGDTAEGGANPFADASSDSAAPGDGGGDGGTKTDGSVKDTRIDPIEVGHAWTYNVTVLGFYPACSNGVFVSNALSQSTVDGKTAVSVQSLCENAGTFKYSVDGDRVYTYLNNSWKTSIDSPVTEGHTWSDGFRDYKWESAGSVTTPAGTFADCWSATVVASYSSYTILCRGVGPVKWHYNDGLGNGYEAILTAKNF